jgi:Na+-transporting NADH:ubiquinone oxidoreductase subunit F
VNDEKELDVPIGGTLLKHVAVTEYFSLFRLWRVGGTCGQCRCRVVEGGGEILPTEKRTFQSQGTVERLGTFELSGKSEGRYDHHCAGREVFGIKEWECEVISNHNVASFIKEFVVKLPEGGETRFQTGFIQPDQGS